MDIPRPSQAKAKLRKRLLIGGAAAWRLWRSRSCWPG